MRYFLAGGAVRDILLGLRAHEFDIVFSGAPEDFVRLQDKPVHTVGKNNQTYIVNGREHMPLVNSIEDDLSRRDLTINALLLEENGVIHALPQTFADLKNRVIRHASPTAFFDDPARVFRAARFAAVLPEFSIAPETLERMRETAGKNLLTIIAGERVGKECVKALGGHAPERFFRILAETGCLIPWFQPLDEACRIPAGPAAHHDKNSIFEHTCEVLARIAAMPYTQTLSTENRALAAWMGLCHDLGKIETDAATLPRHIGHEGRGHGLVRALAERLRLPNRWERAGLVAMALHMKGGRYENLRPGTKADLLLTLSRSDLTAPFCALVMADRNAPHLGPLILRDMEIFLSIKLPEEWRDMGARSAQKYRELRAGALAAGRREY